MSQIRVDQLTKRFGSNTIVDELDLTIEEGEFVVLLGPSGCGKTTTLRCLAGLESPEGGTISFGDKVMYGGPKHADVPSHKRNIGMVFQSYALWPHMKVRDNIAYPLKVRRQKDALRSGAVEKAAEMVDCGALLDRYPSQLSGGQQQRVAVARGLVSEPDLVLFDEPLSNLDARLRDQVRTQIHQLHQRLGFSAVFVTHDQSEAFALGDRLAIMKGGKLEQFETPQRVFDEPASDYVAAFIGMGNKLELTRHADGWRTSNGDRIDLGTRSPERGGVEKVTARLRAADLRLHRAAEEVPQGSVLLHATVVTTEFGGRHHDVLVDVDGEKLTLQADTREHGSWLPTAPEGTPVVVSLRPSDVRVFGEDGWAIADSQSPLQVGDTAGANAR
ncbi:ABC transporter ATP-binding protein [Aeromicrobium alkaliterrae]|uniref:ABC transporter domain-containing protein n=1 Tax=Aeromicrobium alkaliterrae TaxID=302168 RepID=A0ABN2JFK4_9ACTN